MSLFIASSRRAGARHPLSGAILALGILVSACSEDGSSPAAPAADGGGADGAPAEDAAAPETGSDAARPDGGPADGGTPDAPEADAARDPDAAPDAAGDGGGGGDGGPRITHPVWFASDEPIHLSLSGNLGDAFAAAYAGTPDGIVPPVRLKDPFAATFGYPFLDGSAHTDAAMAAVRGNSSLQECAFPKLKVELSSRSSVVGDTFFDTRKVKIGTHCGDEPDVNGTIGRLRHEKAAWREELAYRLARKLGIVTLETRPAIIDYTDTSTVPAFASPLTRQAFLLEHVDELARRLGVTALKDPVDCGPDPTARPAPLSALRVKLFHAMIGNWDWGLGPPETRGCGNLWNTEVLVAADGSVTLVPADFDLAAIVVGEVRDPATNQFVAITTDTAQASAAAYLEPSLQGEAPADVAAMKAEVAAKHAALLAVVEASPVDAEGKQAATLLIDGFFAVLSR